MAEFVHALPKLRIFLDEFDKVGGAYAELSTRVADSHPVAGEHIEQFTHDTRVVLATTSDNQTPIAGDAGGEVGAGCVGVRVDRGSQFQGDELS